MSLQETAKDSYAQSSPANPSRKRPVSERKLQANQQNALRSTGPKTEWGKRTVAQNAIKHGILAREVVITAGDGKESLEEFHDLVKQLQEQYEPIGIVEESLVQTIAACWWRKARVLRAENGEIRKRLDTLMTDRAIQDSDKGYLDVVLSAMGCLFLPDNRTDMQVSTIDRWSRMQVIQTDLRRHPAGLAHLRDLLLDAKSEISSDGYITKKLQMMIFSAFMLWDFNLACTFVSAGPVKAKMGDSII
jgi:hypothetical protein